MFLTVSAGQKQKSAFSNLMPVCAYFVVGCTGIEPSAGWRTYPVKVIKEEKLLKNYLGINVFINSRPLADFNCFSLFIAVFLSGSSSE
jgi:hypothetical protein